MDHGAPEAHAMPAARTEQRERVVTVGLYHRVGLAGEDRGQNVDLNVSARTLSADHQTISLCLSNVGLGLTQLSHMEQVAGQIVLAEVVQQHLPAAHGDSA